MIFLSSYFIFNRKNTNSITKTVSCIMFNYVVIKLVYLRFFQLFRSILRVLEQLQHYRKPFCMIRIYLISLRYIIWTSWILGENWKRECWNKWCWDKSLNFYAQNWFNAERLFAYFSWMIPLEVCYSRSLFTSSRQVLLGNIICISSPDNIFQNGS